MFEIPTLRAPGNSATKERKQSTTSLASSNLLKRRTLSVFSRRTASVSTVSTDTTAVDSEDFAWTTSPSGISSIADRDAPKFDTSNTWSRRHSTFPKPKSIPIVTAYDSLGGLMVDSANDEILQRIKPPTETIIASSISESEADDFTLPVEKTSAQSRRSSIDKPKIQITIPRSSSPPPLFLRNGALAPNNSPSTRLFIQDSPDLSDSKSSQHRREISTSTVGSVYSNYDRDADSDEASKRSSVTSAGSEFEKFSLHSEVKYSPVRHQSQEYEEMLASQDSSLNDIVDLLRSDSLRKAVCVSRQSCVDNSILRTLNEDEAAAFTPSANSEVDLEVVIALQIQKQQQQQRRLSGSFGHLRQPPVPPKSERRRSSIASVNDFSPLPSPLGLRISTLSDCVASQTTLGVIDEAQAHAALGNLQILECIMSQAADLQDLFNLAVVNKDFHMVFKKHELPLIQSALKNMSPAGWEFKQMLSHDEEEDADSAAPVPDFTAETFYRSYLRDYSIIAGLKHKIHEQCNSVVRMSTAPALTKNDAHRQSYVDDALWRIWTFSKIFGGGKDREDDIATQLDWLRGGINAHALGATSSVLASDSWYATSALLSASEHFAAGNCGGLDADRLYDMIEMWDSLRTITSKLAGQVELARVYGIFSGRASHQERTEDAMLEEWHNYVLTCGLSTVNRIANAETSLSAFQLARDNKWTIWTSLSTATISSRAVFLRQPVNKMYEERIYESFSSQEALSKQPQLSRRKSPSPDRGIEFDTAPSSPRPGSQASSSFSDEVMMSRANTVINRLNAAYPAPLRLSISGPIPDEASLGIHPAFRKSFSAASSAGLAHSSTTASTTSFSSSSSSSSTTTAPPPAQLQHPFQLALASPDPSTTSADRATFRIVEMGFTAEQAQGALKITDQGEGLCVDRAVEYLLRQ